jgi:hypothetical protein
VYINGQYLQAMDDGSSSATFEDLDTRVEGAEADIDALQAITAENLLSADGAVPVTASKEFTVTKASAAALSVAATATNGIRLRIKSASSFAHVLTFTGSTLQDGATEAGLTITFANKKGAFVEVESYDSKWMVLYGNHYTVA